MRYLILSDIHGNADALAAVLSHAAGQYDRIVNCGDIVGYGPSPSEAVRFCREKCAAVVRGNHDMATAGVGNNLEWFNAVAQASVRWSRTVLTEHDIDYLRSLPRGPLEVDDFCLMHGAPADEDEYVTSVADAADAAQACPTPVGFFGHTHLQGAYHVNRHGARSLNGAEFEARDTGTYLINPGSVGQPRDGDRRAAYAIYDAARRYVQLLRVEYDIDKVYEKVRAAGLPQQLGLRLYSGT